MSEVIAPVPVPEQERLTAAIQAIVPGAQIVRITPVSTTRYGIPERRYVALALARNRRALPVPPGGTDRLVRLLRAVDPSACRTGTWTWRARSGEVRLQRPGRIGGDA